MALVGVEHLRRRRAGQARPQTQGADPADAEQHLLLQPVLASTAVQPVGDRPCGVVVLGHVGVEQQQRHASHVRLPHVCHEAAATGQLDDDLAGRAVGLAELGQRQLVRVQDRVVLGLPPVRGERLLEVAALVEQADTGDGHAEVGRALEVVAGEDPETARVLRQDRRDAELRAEVGDGRRRVIVQALVPAGLGQVRVQVVGRGAHPGRRTRGRPRGPSRRSVGRSPSRRTGSCRSAPPSAGGPATRTGRASGRATTTAGSGPAARGRRSCRAGLYGR